MNFNPNRRVPIRIITVYHPPLIVLFIVDGCHFQGQRKMKKSTSGKASHLGCSESYSFMAYKPYTQLQIDGAHNSQGREQMHSVPEKLAPSLRQMNYSNFMRTLIIFFSVHNLWTMDKL